MVLLARAPGRTWRLLAEGERLKLGAIGVLFAHPVIVGNKDAAKKTAINLKQSNFRK